MRNHSLVSFPTRCRRFFCQSIPHDLYDPPFSPSRKGDGDSGNVGLKSDRKGDDDSGNVALKSDLPFHFRYSYSETDPSIKPTSFRESPKFSPFGPGRLDRKWTGTCAPVNHQVEINRIEEERNSILGAPLEDHEVSQLVERYRHSDCSRQINLGKGGVTHNTLDDIHNHWKKAEAVRIKCLGVPTLDMDNICFHLEDKSGGKIIYRNINILLLYRGRHYDPTKRPLIPLMLWKPYAPIYPKLVNNLIPTLTHVQTKQLRNKGFNSHPLIKLTRNGVYVNVVERVREAFKTDEVLRLDCTHVGTTDCKKIGVKLRIWQWINTYSG
ncbi:hypothetical protein RYX36_007214 [Vicia faba]